MELVSITTFAILEVNFTNTKVPLWPTYPSIKNIFNMVSVNGYARLGGIGSVGSQTGGKIDGVYKLLMACFF